VSSVYVSSVYVSSAVAAARRCALINLFATAPAAGLIKNLYYFIFVYLEHVVFLSPTKHI